MDANRFDALTQQVDRVLSRRTAFGVAISPVLFAPTRRPRQSCTANGHRCKRSAQCCSGVCKREDKKLVGRRPKKQCAPDHAKGCTLEAGACGGAPCPKSPDGFCTVSTRGEPFCATTQTCFACEWYGDCFEEFGASNSRCVECPDTCGPEFNARACVWFTPS